MNRGLKNDEIYDDIDNGLLFLETGMIVYRKEYIDGEESIFFGSYNLDDDGNGIIFGYKTKEKLGFFKYGTPYYSKIGLLKLGNMDIHIMGKAAFEDNITRYLSTNINGKHKQLYINLDGTLDDMRLFFLKYVNREVLTKIMWYLIRDKSVSIRLELNSNLIIYSIAHYLDSGNLDKHDIKFYKVNDFLKEYETMGLELTPVIEETKPLEFPQSADGLTALLDSFKDNSLIRGKPTTNDFKEYGYVHPRAFKRTDKIEPFRKPTGGARCTMMDEIKNLTKKTLYPKTTTINNLSIDKDRIINAYNTFIYSMLNIEKYTAISIRVPRDYNDDWFKILPCFNAMKESALRIQDDLDTYVNIKRIGSGDSRNYTFDISGLDTTPSNINSIRNKIQFFASDIILNLNITDLQTRLIDLIIEDKPSIVDSKDEVNINDNLVSEVKDNDSKVSENEVNDVVHSPGQLMNNLLRGLPVDYVDNFDLDGDTITHEIKFKNKLTDLKEVKDNDSKVSETDSKPMEETIRHRNIDNAYKLLNNILTSSDYIRHGKIPAGAIEYITLLVNGDKGIPNPNKIDNTGYTIRKVRPTQSTFKRLSESDKLDTLTVDDIVDNTELNMLKELYDKHIGVVSIRCKKDRNMLDDNYRALFKKHIAKGVLYPSLKFDYEYGYIVNENSIIEYTITGTKIVPFKSMISNKPMNIHADIAEKYIALIKTQASVSSVSNSVDEEQIETCISIYNSMFSKYIELGILKDDLIFDLYKNRYVFPAIWSIYNDSYVSQDKPTRLYNIYLNIVISFSSDGSLKYVKNTLTSVYRTLFKRYIDLGLMKPEIEYPVGLPFPTIDKLWLHR